MEPNLPPEVTVHEVAPAPQEAPAPQVDQGPQVSYYQQSPDQMIQAGVVDPQLYSGMRTPDGYTISTMKDQRGWQINYAPEVPGLPNKPNDYAVTIQQANDILAKESGVNLADNRAALVQQHMGQILRDASINNLQDVSNSVLEFYGPQLSEVLQKYNDNPVRLGTPAPPMVRTYNLKNFSPLDSVREATGLTDRGARILVPGSKGGVNIQMRDLESHIPTSPGTYVLEPDRSVATGVQVVDGKKKITQRPVDWSSYHAIAKRMEVWRKTYAPEMKILLAPMKLAPGDTTNGQMFKLKDGTFVLGINQRTMTNVPYSYVVASHEFGHALIMHELMKSNPGVVMQFVNDWLSHRATYLNEQGPAGVNNRRIAEFGGVHRISMLNGNTTEPADHWTNYQMGFDEYMADQVSQYLYDEGSMFGEEQRGFLQKIATLLKEFYDRVASRFKVAPGFQEWMNALRDGAKSRPVDAYKDHPVDVVTRPKKQAAPNVQVGIDDLLRMQLPQPDPTDLDFTKGLKTSPELASRLEKELNKWGANVEDFKTDGILDREAAYQYLEMMGQDTAPFMDSVDREDDTTGFRGSVASIGLKFPDLMPHIARTNEAVKNFNWFFQKTLTAVQIRKRYGAQVPGAKLFVDLLEKMHSYKSRWKAMADDRIKEMKDISKKERNAVFQVLLDEDAQGYWLSQAKKLPDGSYMRVLDPAEAKKRGITEKGAQLYADLIQDFKKSLDELETLAIRELQRTYSGQTPESQNAMQEAIRKLQVEFAKMRSTPYVPHTRFGEYTVTVMQEGKVTEFYQFEKQRDAQNLATKLRAQGKTASAGRMREDVRAFLGMPPSLITSMKDSLNLTQDQIRQFEDLMKNLSAGQSFVRRMKERKNIPGYENDAEMYPRVYADYFSRFANHSARLNFNYQLNEAEAQVRAQTKDLMGDAIDTANLTSLHNWMQRTHEWVMSPRDELARIRSAVTLWYLGFSVKSAFVNGMSVPMVTIPYLSSRYGSAKAAVAVTAAYRDAARHWMKPSVLTDDEAKMLANLREQGVLDESLSAMLAGIREGGQLADATALGNLKATEYKMKYYGMWMFHKIELANRYGTALAAYRLAKTQQSFDPHDLDGFDRAARDFAKAAVQDTQNENAQWNRAELMRGGKSVFTMFMSYQQNVMYQMFGGDQSWLRLLAVQLTLAGLMGLPFAKDLDNLVKWFSRKVLGDDQSIEKATRAYLEDTFINPDILLKGSSYNVFGENLQGSLSMGQVIPGLDALAMEGSFADRLSNAAGDVGGAGASVLLEFMKAMASNKPADINRFINVLPAAFKNVKQGYDMLTTGSANNSQGDPIAEVTKTQAALKLFGVQPTQASQASELRFVQKDAAQFWLTRRQYVLTLYYRAVKDQDGDALDAAKEALLKYNDEVPSAALRLDGKTVRNSVNSQFKADFRTEHDLPSGKKNFQLYQDIAAGYQPP